MSLQYVGPTVSEYKPIDPRIIGEVKNIGKEVIVGLRVEITVYGKKGRILIDEREREVAFWTLERNEVSPFCIYLTGGVQRKEEIKGVKFELIESEEIRALLEISQVDIHKSIYHGLKLKDIGIVWDTIAVEGTTLPAPYICATIINKGKRTVKSNLIVAMFYDAQGNLIDYRKHSAFEGITGAKFLPGSSRTFRLDIPQEVIRHKYYTYKLKVLSIAK